MGIGEQSQARILSSFRAFYRYLLVEDLIDSDPMELIQAPVAGDLSRGTVYK